jgi:hypothetical protein
VIDEDDPEIQIEGRHDVRLSPEMIWHFGVGVFDEYD